MAKLVWLVSSTADIYYLRLPQASRRLTCAFRFAAPLVAGRQALLCCDGGSGEGLREAKASSLLADP